MNPLHIFMFFCIETCVYLYYLFIRRLHIFILCDNNLCIVSCIVLTGPTHMLDPRASLVARLCYFLFYVCETPTTRTFSSCALPCQHHSLPSPKALIYAFIKCFHFLNYYNHLSCLYIRTKEMSMIALTIEE